MSYQAEKTSCSVTTSRHSIRHRGRICWTPLGNMLRRTTFGAGIIRLVKLTSLDDVIAKFWVPLKSSLTAFSGAKMCFLLAKT